MQRPPSSPTSAVPCAWLVLMVTIQLALQTSTEASGRFYYVFYVKVNLDPEVDSRRGNLDIISTSSTWQFIRHLQRLLEEFLLVLLWEEEEEEEEEENQIPVWVPGQLLLMTSHRISFQWIPCSVFGCCLRRTGSGCFRWAWFDSGYVPDAFRRISHIFIVMVDSYPEVDSWACPGPVRTRKSGHSSCELLVDV